MKKQDIKAMSVSELKDRIAVEKSNLKKLKVAHQLTEIENPLRIRDNKRLVAKLLTELTVKEKDLNNVTS